MLVVYWHHISTSFQNNYNAVKQEETRKEIEILLQ